MAIGYAKVFVDIGAFIADADDVDDKPDETPLSATLTLTPQLVEGKPLVYDNGTTKTLKLVAPIEVPIGPAGVINHQGKDYVMVLAPTSVETNMVGQLQYQASFSDVRYGNARTKIDPIYFYVSPDDEINLAEHTGVVPVINTGPAAGPDTGAPTPIGTLFLPTVGDFEHSYTLTSGTFDVDAELYYLIGSAPTPSVRWDYDLDDDTASIVKASTAVAPIASGTPYWLMFKPTAAGTARELLTGTVRKGIS